MQVQTNVTQKVALVNSKHTQKNYAKSEERQRLV